METFRRLPWSSPVLTALLTTEAEASQNWVLEIVIVIMLLIFLLLESSSDPFKERRGLVLFSAPCEERQGSVLFSAPCVQQLDVSHHHRWLRNAPLIARPLL